MSTTSEKKVVLRFEVADAGASQQLGKIADNAKSAANAAKDLKQSVGGPSGGWGGHAPPSMHAMGFPSMAGGSYGPADAHAMNMAALAATGWRDPAVALAGMRGSGGAAGGPSGWDSRALAQAGRTPSSGWNPAALAESARRMIDPNTGMMVDSYRMDSLRHARYSGTQDEMMQTMNRHRTDPGMLAAAGAGAYRLGAAGLRYGVPAVAALATGSAVIGAAHSAELVEYQGGTTGEQLRAIGNGTWLTRQGLGIADTIRGRTQGIERVEYDMSRRLIAREGAEEQRQFRDDVRIQRMELEARAGVLNADGRMARVGTFDRGTVQGELDYGRSLQTLGARQSVIDTERGLKVGEDVLGRQTTMRDELERRRQRLEIDAGRLATDAGNAGGVERARLLGERGLKLDEIQKAEQQLEKLNKDIEQSRGKIVGLRAEANQAKIGVLRADLNIAQQRESRSASQAAKYGAMSNLEFDLGVAASRQAQAGGLRSLTPEQDVRFRSFAPERYEKMAQAEFLKSGRYDFAKEFGDANEDKLPNTRKAAEQAQNKFIDGIRDAERQAADQANDQLLSQKFVDTILSGFGRIIDKKIAAIENEMMRRNNKQ